MKVNLKRWLRARDSEKSFWANKDVKAIKSSMDWMQLVKSHFDLTPDYFTTRTCLEVGCGPYGLIHFIDSNCKVGIDPIPFKKWSDVEEFNDSTMHIIATGENLPFRDSIFSVCICFNVLDHSINPIEIVQEIGRTLGTNNKFLLWVHTIKSSLKLMAPFFSLIDRSHPYHLTNQEIIKIISDNQLNPITIKQENITSDLIQLFTHLSFKLIIARFIMFNLFIYANNQK